MLSTRRKVLVEWLRWAAAGVQASRLGNTSALAPAAVSPPPPTPIARPLPPVGAAPGLEYRRFFDVRAFGAVGDGTTDDTAAIQTAAAAFERACRSGQSPFTTAGAHVLYLPAGNYRISDTIVVSNIQGGIIEGDGKYQTRLLGSNLGGKPAMLQLVNCQHTTVRDLEAYPNAQYTVLAADCPVGSTRLQVASVVGLAVGQRIGLSSRDRATAELLTIAAVSAGAVVTTTPTLYAYSAGAGHSPADFVATCVFSVFQSYSSYRGTGYAPTQNVFQNCRAGSDGACAALVGFSTDCLGGGPTYLTQPGRKGSRSLTVFDAGRQFVGGRIRLCSTPWSPGETAVVARVSGPTVTLEEPLTNDYPEFSYVVSQSDVNNELHSFIHCSAGNCVVAGWDIGHWNSLDVQIIASTAQACFAGVTCTKGGSFSAIGMANGALGVDFVLGGGTQHAIKLYGVMTEGDSQMLFAHPSYRLFMPVIDIVNYDKKGGPRRPDRPLIDLTGASRMVLNMSQCNLSLGSNPGQHIVMFDASGRGQLNLNGGCNLGCDGYTLAGVALRDFGSSWTSADPLVERLTNDASVQAAFVGYGNRRSNGLRRTPARLAVSAPTLSDVDLQAGPLVEVVGPTGPLTISGVRHVAGHDEFDLTFEFVQPVTILHQSTASKQGNRVCCPSQRDLVLAGPCAVRLKFSSPLDAWIVLSHS